MGLGLPLLVIILAMAVLVGLAVARAFFLMRTSRRAPPKTPEFTLIDDINMIGGPDCEGCRRAPRSVPPFMASQTQSQSAAKGKESRS